MYPSGIWRGFWEQPRYGRQAMQDFRLAFHDGAIEGRGTDLIGRFVFRGEFDTNTGRVRMVKQYLGKHQVLYEGGPDGEGSIAGTWSIDESWTGPFLMQPVLLRPTGDEPIHEVTK
jgi:hypothetical protein